jgi:excinuclease UvrABC helicase subunit UvrB
MYRELVIKAFRLEEINKIDQLRRAGIDMTDLVLAAVISADIDKLLRDREAMKS